MPSEAAYRWPRTFPSTRGFVRATGRGEVKGRLNKLAFVIWPKVNQFTSRQAINWKWISHQLRIESFHFQSLRCRNQSLFVINSISIKYIYCFFFVHCSHIDKASLKNTAEIWVAINFQGDYRACIGNWYKWKIWQSVGNFDIIIHIHILYIFSIFFWLNK